jgi:ATP-dependent Clp protease ATP-binding subunit ClpX
MSKKVCSFCKKESSRKRPILSGFEEGVYICKSCVISAYKIFMGEEISEEKIEEKEEFNIKKFSPKDLKAFLDSYVIGQDRAKKVLSVAVYNHYKRLFNSNQKDSKELEEELKDVELLKSNILLIGPTGSGKTYLAQTIAKFLDLPLAIADATALTEAGYVGEDAESVVSRLYQAAGESISKTEKGIIFIDEIDKIARTGENRSITRDVSGEGVQQALLKIIEGSLINITPHGGRKHPQDNFIPINTKDILFICGGAFEGLDDIIKKRLGKNQIGFDPQKDLKKVDNDENVLEYLTSDDLVKYGLIPELIGRLHVVETLDKIDLEGMIRILKEPKNSLIKQYQKLFELDGVKLTFEEEAIKKIAQKAFERKTGARGLRSIMENLLTDIMFELPELKGYEVIITPDVVENGAKPLYLKQKKSA